MISSRLALISIVLVLAAGCGGGYAASSTSPSPAPTPVASSSITIPTNASALGARAYNPDAVEVTAGTTVTWTNSDSVAHTSTSDAAGWDSGLVAPGAQFSVAFPTAGTFQYHCTIHPGMVGSVVVR